MQAGQPMFRLEIGSLDAALAAAEASLAGAQAAREGALATVVPDAGSTVFVALYDIADADASRLDEWESATTGLYRRIRLHVHTLDGPRVAWGYVLDAFEGGLPSAGTLHLMADAAELCGAPDDYVAGLRNRPAGSP